MATVVDALLVTLGLDTKGYEKGTKKAEEDLAVFDKKRSESEKKEKQAREKAAKEREKQHREQQHQRKETYESMAKIRNQLLAVFGLFTAGQGLLAFAKNTIDTAANIGRLSDNTKVAVGDIAGLEQAFKRTGGSAEEAQQTIGMLAKELQKPSFGQQSNFTMFRYFGGKTKNGGFPPNAKEYLLDIADLLHKINKENPAKAWVVAGQLGLNDTAFNLAKQGRKAVEGQMADGNRMAAITRKQTDEAQKAQRTWADMSTMMASVGRAVLIPVLEVISDWMIKHKKDIQVWLDQLRKFLAAATPAAIAKIGQEFEKFAKAINSIADSLIKLQPLMEKLGLMAPSDVGFTAKIAAEQQQIKHYWANRHAAHAAPGAGHPTAVGDTSVHIGQMNIHTQATDAKGVAAGMHDAIRQQGMAHQLMAQ